MEIFQTNILSTDKTPGAIRPYSQGYEINGVVYISGQIPVNSVDGTVTGGIATQAEQSCKNMGAILEAAGTGFGRVFKTTCSLTDMNDFGTFSEVYTKYFVPEPARSCVAVRTPPKGVLCKIEAVVVK